jgi:hypothetical protein
MLRKLQSVSSRRTKSYLSLSFIAGILGLVNRWSTRWSGCNLDEVCDDAALALMVVIGLEDMSED